MTAEHVVAVARQLTPDERTDVMAAINPAADKAQSVGEFIAVLEERIAACRSKPSAIHTWEQVEAELDADE